MRRCLLLLSAVFPWPRRRLLLTKALGWEVHHSARIGLASPTPLRCN
jgi:hypothetical protein